MRKTARRYLTITLGALIFSLSFDWFFASNEVALGGATGLAQVIHFLLPGLSVGTLALALNVPLFLVGWAVFGFSLLASSLFAVAISSLGIDLIAMIHSFSPVQPMLAAVCGGALMGFGLGLIFRAGATTGGTDIVARLLKKRFSWLPIGRLILLSDCVVLLLAAVTFGRFEAALYGVIALYVSTQVMDTVLYGLDSSKVAYIISDHWQEIAGSLLREQERGVTVLEGEGAYTGQKKRVLLVAFKRKEITSIKEIIFACDPGAFLIVCDAHDVRGVGFRAYKKEEI